MRDARGIEASLSNVKDTDLDTIVNCDAILLGGPTRGIKKFIDKLSSLPLAGKQFAVFDTYMGKDVEKAVRKMEQRIHEKAPALKMLARGLSMQVQGTKGPIVDAELPKCKEFGTAIAATLMAPS